MSIHSLAGILQPAIGHPWAVGAYDVVSLAMCEGVIQAAVENQAPVIFLIYPSSVESRLFRPLQQFIQKESNEYHIPTSVVLDHGSSIAQIKSALESGFSGVMIDGSSLPFEENVRLVKEVVSMAHPLGVSVEAELGHVGEGNAILSYKMRKEKFTDVDLVEEFVNRTGIDALAIAIGTAHGVYHFEPELDILRLQEIRARVDTALVLHGSSGTPESQLTAAVHNGIDKVNVYTDIRLKVMGEIKNYMAAVDLEKADMTNIDEIIKLQTTAIVKDKNQLFGSVGKASKWTDI